MMNFLIAPETTPTHLPLWSRLVRKGIKISFIFLTPKYSMKYLSVFLWSVISKLQTLQILVLNSCLLRSPAKIVYSDRCFLHSDSKKLHFGVEFQIMPFLLYKQKQSQKQINKNKINTGICIFTLEFKKYSNYFYFYIFIFLCL